jgi:uncharacterized membrane protein
MTSGDDAADGADEEPGRAAIDDLPQSQRIWGRGEEPEFGRFAFFTDAVFAIALTLLVLSIELPPLRGDANAPATMFHALGHIWDSFLAFGIAFVLLGRYWIEHHEFVGSLRAIDRALLWWNLLYLAGVALLPFPTSLVSKHESNPVSVIFFALVLAAISGVETVMYVHARRADLERRRLSDVQHRWGVIASLTPVAMFLVTAPFAFIDPTWTLLSWAVLPILTARLYRRLAPEEVKAMRRRPRRTQPRAS